MKDRDVFMLRDSSLGLVEKEALHQWARSRMGFPLPYDQLQRICTQLEEQPNQQKWSLQVGRGWIMMRNGAVLSATREAMEFNEQDFVEQRLDWSIVANDGEPEVTKDAIHIQLRDVSVDKSYSFVLSNANHVRKLGFTPPWRENPVRLCDFLRGQKVLLHRRDCASVIYLKGDEPCLIAVFVERQDGVHNVGGTKGKWVVDAEFSATTVQEVGQRKIRLKLPTRCSPRKS